MIFLSNIIRIKIISIIALFIALVFLGYEYFHSYRPNIWGDEPDESYITITGKKPKDAKVDAWARWGASGDACKARTFSFSNVKWSKGANVKWHITQDFSTDSNRYELRVPYQKYHDSLDCDVELGRVIVQAYNGYGSAGFAQLRISPAGKEYYNRPIDFKLSIAAKDCEPYYSEKFNRWTKGFGCYYYVDEKMKSQDQEFNAYHVYYDFSKFNNDTVIHYDILAGEKYRSEPLDKEKGPQ
ncbi:hypothetical protein ACPFUG_002483 [Vibrio cholerae]